MGNSAKRSPDPLLKGEGKGKSPSGDASHRCLKSPSGDASCSGCWLVCGSFVLTGLVAGRYASSLPVDLFLPGVRAV